ncbi:N-acetylneuraminate synthase family protein [Solemya pervernicosa gill symbiont]|uniref:N-acetylneuraminate synthase family protein n=1 Tax=Solemya pervernicosa gill symbiont TaxID=642797 RepID=UPI0010826DFE|nr:N-acetylneuraminate synthase family protein [Solemya pervernicosa gill symbiont]
MNSENLFEINGRAIASGQPCYLVAEVGTTCLGELSKALDLIAAAADAGMDAVKFQMIDPDQLSDDEVEYRFSAGGVEHVLNMKEMFERLSFSDDEWSEVQKACLAHGVDFFATVDYVGGVDRLEKLNVAVHKIGAWDITYRQLVEKIAATGKSLIVDLGPAAEKNLDDLVEWTRTCGGGNLLLLHDFHTSIPEQMNMQAISYLNHSYKIPCGFSSPARDDDLDVLAIGLGAVMLEKRLIMSREEIAFHADESLEPDELKVWVSRIRHVESALGKQQVIPSDADIELSKEYFRSVCTLAPIAKGEQLSEDNVGAKRPGIGIPTTRMREFIGKECASSLEENHLIREEDVL